MSGFYLTLYTSDAFQQRTNTLYPHKKEINTPEELKEAVRKDYVCALFADPGTGEILTRARDHFFRADCVALDFDNDHTEEPAGWITPEEIRERLPGVAFAVTPSRNHLREKNGKEPRPKYHAFFPVDEVRTAAAYEDLTGKLLQLFPEADKNAADAARFFFGVEEPEAEIIPGRLNLSEYFDLLEGIPDGAEEEAGEILQGERNSTLYKYAVKALKRYGAEKARALFLQRAGCCVPPLEDAELKTIWRSAAQFFRKVIKTRPDYVPPEEYEKGAGGKGRGKGSAALILDVIRFLNRQGIHIRQNLLTRRADIEGLPEEFSSTEAGNTLPALVYDGMRAAGIRVTRQTVLDALALEADRNRFHPVQALLMEEWDGAERLPELLRLLGIQTSAFDCVLVKKWLLQAVALTFNDDREPQGADGVLVLQGDQGTGKTLFFRRLALRSEWFGEGVSLNMEKTDAKIAATSKFITELGELDSTLKREQSALKGFITSARDEFRKPYARAAVFAPRRTSFAGTVNPEEFLIDDTGGRRFWVVHPVIDLEKLQQLPDKWFLQLWREMYRAHYLKNPLGFRLTFEERQTLEERNRAYYKTPLGYDELLEVLDFSMPAEEWREVTAAGLKLCGGYFHGISVKQIGRAAAYLADTMPEVKTKLLHGVRLYRLPLKGCYVV